MSKIKFDSEGKDMNELLDYLNSENGTLYFLSDKNMNNETLIPRVPDNFLTKNEYEDNITKRICFATSIDKALIALSQNLKDKEFYVHIIAPGVKYNVRKPTVKEVPDCKITGEMWITTPVRIKAISKIKVTGDGDNEFSYTYGDNKKATLYDWKWKKIKDFTEFTILLNYDGKGSKYY